MNPCQSIHIIINPAFAPPNTDYCIFTPLIHSQENSFVEHITLEFVNKPKANMHFWGHLSHHVCLPVLPDRTALMESYHYTVSFTCKPNL